MTKEGCPVAHPRFSRRPSARMMTPWPSGKMKRSHWGLMVCTGVCACVCVGGRGKHFSVVFGTKQAGQRKHAYDLRGRPDVSILVHGLAGHASGWPAEGSVSFRSLVLT